MHVISASSWCSDGRDGLSLVCLLVIHNRPRLADWVVNSISSASIGRGVNEAKSAPCPDDWKSPGSEYQSLMTLGYSPSSKNLRRELVQENSQTFKSEILAYDLSFVMELGGLKEANMDLTTSAY